MINGNEDIAEDIADPIVLKAESLVKYPAPVEVVVVAIIRTLLQLIVEWLLDRNQLNYSLPQRVEKFWRPLPK